MSETAQIVLINESRYAMNKVGVNRTVSYTGEIMNQPSYPLFRRAATTLSFAAMLFITAVAPVSADEVSLAKLFESGIPVTNTELQSFDSSKSVTGNTDYKTLMTKCRGYDNVDCDGLLVFGVVNKTDAPESQRAMNKMTIISPSGRRRIEPVDISGGILKYEKSKVLDNEIAVINVGFYKGANKTPFQRCDTDFVFCGSKVVGCPTNTDGASCSPTVAINVQVNMNCSCAPNERLVKCENNKPQCVAFIGGPICEPGEVGVGDKCKKSWNCSSLPAGAPSLANTCVGSAITIGPDDRFFPTTLTCTGTKLNCPVNGGVATNPDQTTNPDPSGGNTSCKAGEVADGKVCKKAWTCGTLNGSEIDRLAQVCTTSSETFARSGATYYPSSLSCPGSKACGDGSQDPGCKDERADTVVKALFCTGDDAKDNCSKVRGSGTKNCTNCAAATKNAQNGMSINLPEAKDQITYKYYALGNHASTNTQAQSKNCGQFYTCDRGSFTSDNRPAADYTLIQYKCLGGEWAETSRYAYAACNCSSYRTEPNCGKDDITRLQTDGGICFGGDYQKFYGAKGQVFKQGEGMVGRPEGQLLEPGSF